MNEVLVSIMGSQNVCGGFEGGMELVTEGRLYRSNEDYILEYDESELSGMYGTKTRITFGTSYVDLTREGTFNTRFVFEKLKPFQGCYFTPDGEMDMTLLPTSLSTEVDEVTGYGNVDVVYELAVNGERSNNQLQVRFKSKADIVQ